jgi:hypothetical protein
VNLGYSSLSLKQAVLAIIFPVLGGCTFSAPQAESAMQLVRTISQADGSGTNDASAVWLGSVRNRGAVLTPFITNDLIVFANADGDAVAFDGWTVRSITGFGLSEPLSISGKEGVRIFAMERSNTVTTCDPWALVGLTWTQSCANGNGEIVLGEDGNIETISLSLGKTLGVLTLRVAK